MTEYKNIDLEKISHKKLTYMILTDIANGKITSAHFTKEQAEGMLYLIDM